MSGFEEAVDPAALAETNPLVDRDQLDEANQVVGRLRQAGIAPVPGYRIDSPYERGPVEQPRSAAARRET